MNHTDCRLRPLDQGDRDRVLAWRNQDRIRTNMYTDHVIGREEHDRWFDRSLTDGAAAYRIFEHRGRPLGFVSFTGIDRAHGRSTWAFYLGEADAPRGSGAAMEVFALDEAFGALGIRKLCCEVFAFNAGVIRLHERFGFQREGLFKEHYIKNGEPQDVVCMARFAQGWAGDRALLMPALFQERPV